MKRITALTAIAASLLLSGCGGEQPTQVETSPDIDGTQYLLAAEPEDVQGVIETRQAAKDGDLVVVVGRIGGSSNPWVEGRAAFSIVDPALRACSDIEGDECQQPWDYCCETDRLPEATVLVKLVDAPGELVAVDARELLGLEELQIVVVQGQAQRDDAGNLTILASGIHVRS
jgi:hypothetical protein